MFKCCFKKKNLDDYLETPDRLAIVVGHTKKKSGAYSKYIAESEYEFNSLVAEDMVKIAQEYGLYPKIFLRDEVGIRGAYRAVNKWLDGHNGCSIELHFNAANGKARGTETLYDLDPAGSYDLAVNIQRQMLSCFGTDGRRDRGLKRRVKGDRGYYNLEQCKHPSVIVEPFFGDNKKDAELAMIKRAYYPKVLVLGAIDFLSGK